MSDEVVGEALAEPLNDGVITMGDLKTGPDAEDMSTLNFMERKERLKQKYESAVPDAEDEEDTVVFVDNPPAEAEKPAVDEVLEGDIPGLEPPVEPVVDPAKDADEGELPVTGDSPSPGKFKVRDHEGNFVKAPDVKVDFTVGDKSYRKDVPGLVRMAVDAVAGQQHATKARQLEQEVIPSLRSEYESKLQAIGSDFEAQSNLIRRILSDPTGQEFQRQLEAWEVINSPEARAQQAQERAAELEKQMQQQQRTQTINQVNETHIKPLVELIGRECPDVDGDALLGLMQKHMIPLQGPDGIIPQERYGELVARLNGPVLQEARLKQKRFNDMRTEQVAKFEAEKKAEAEKNAKLLREAQRKQNATVAAISPVKASTATSDSTTSTPPPIKSMADWRKHVNSSYKNVRD